MDVFETVAILLTLAAVLSYVNHRWLKMPPTIALMLGSFALSLALVAIGALPLPFGQHIQGAARHLVEGMNFGEVMMKGMLGLLLFAGSLHVQLNDLAEYKWQIATYATIGTVASTFLVAGLVFGLSGVMSLGITIGKGIHGTTQLQAALICPHRRVVEPIAHDNLSGHYQNQNHG